MKVLLNNSTRIIAMLFLGAIAVSLLAYAYLSGKNETAPLRPNILLIFTDDQGYNGVSIFGGDIPTPNMDMIAQGGIQFNQAYVAAPICTPLCFAHGEISEPFPRSASEGFNVFAR